MCGNYPEDRYLERLARGSPPRVRELLTEGDVLGMAVGITPACAGITTITSHPPAKPWDHPRVCGNYVFFGFGNKLARGSPPRVRELPLQARKEYIMARITPACAGITRLSRSVLSFIRDHPRVCGNYMVSPVLLPTITGSPPRVRELPDSSMQRCIKVRITPACAGIT